MSKSTSFLMRILILGINAIFLIAISLSSTSAILTMAIFCTFLVLSVKFLYDGNWKSKFLIVVMLFVLAQVTEFIIATIFAYIFSYSLDTLLDADSALWIATLVSAKFLQFIILEILVRIIKIKTDLLPLKQWLILMTIPLVSIVIVLFLSSFPSYGDQFLMIGFIITCIGLLVVNFIVFMLFEELSNFSRSQVENKLMKQQVQMQTAHYKEMEKSIRETASMWHDFKNHMLAVQAYLHCGKLSELEQYLQKITQSTLKSQPIYTGNSIIDVILTEKIELAHRIGISIKHKICLPENLDIDPMELCVILGNALDNAIESCQKVNIQEPINVSIISHKNYLSITIANPIKNRPEKLGDRFITTKEDPLLHGLGLKNVERSLERCGGRMYLDSDGGLFKFSAVLPISVIVTSK